MGPNWQWQQQRRQQEQMRRQQEQMRRQQEQMRRQQEMGAWYEQQRRKQQEAWVGPPYAPAKRKSRPLGGCAVFVVGLVITAVAGLAAMGIALDMLEGDLYEFVNSTAICAVAVWLGGFILTVVLAIRAWRG